MVKCKDCRFGGLKVLLDNESAPCLKMLRERKNKGCMRISSMMYQRK